MQSVKHDILGRGFVFVEQAFCQCMEVADKSYWLHK